MQHQDHWGSAHFQAVSPPHRGISDRLHPFEPTLSGQRAAIEAFLDGHPASVRHAAAVMAVDVAVARRAARQVERARVERLVRAHDTVELAGHLAAVGGDDWSTFLALRACESAAP